MLNNENDEDLLNFDEPLDMTDPNRPIQNNTFNGSVYDRRRMYDDTPKVQKIKTPIIQRITGFLVIIAMLIAVAFLGYMASKGNFDVDKELSLFKSVGILVYGVFLIDSIVVYGVNKRTSVIMFALLLPVFYPIKRAYVTSDTKTVPMIWLVVFSVLGIFIFSNVHVQIERKIELIKTSADDYPSNCDDAVKMLKGKMIGDRTVMEIVKQNLDDYEWEAEKLAGNSYSIYAKGNCDFTIDGIPQPDALYNNNTKICFNIDESTGVYKVNFIAINGTNLTPQQAVQVWEYICNNKE